MIARPKYFYMLYIPLETGDHYLAYSNVIGSYYVATSSKNAEKFLTVKDAIESYDEYCDINLVIKKKPEVIILGFHTALKGNV